MNGDDTYDFTPEEYDQHLAETIDALRACSTERKPFILVTYVACDDPECEGDCSTRVHAMSSPFHMLRAADSLARNALVESLGGHMPSG